MTDINYISALIDERNKKIKIKLEKRRKRTITVISAYSQSKRDLKTWKRMFSCNGFTDENINLQGDQRERVKSYLEKDFIVELS